MIVVILSDIRVAYQWFPHRLSIEYSGIVFNALKKSIEAQSLVLQSEIERIVDLRACCIVSHTHLILLVNHVVTILILELDVTGLRLCAQTLNRRVINISLVFEESNSLIAENCTDRLPSTLKVAIVARLLILFLNRVLCQCIVDSGYEVECRRNLMIPLRSGLNAPTVDDTAIDIREADTSHRRVLTA